VQQATTDTLSQPADALAANAVLQSQVINALAKQVIEIGKQLHSLRESITVLSRRPPAVYVGDHLALTRILNGPVMYVDSRDASITPKLLTEGIYEPSITAFLAAAIRPEMKIVDIGANMGYFTLVAAAAAGPEGRVYAFEPHPRSYEILQKNVSLNWYSSRVQCFPYALLNEAKQMELHTTTSCLGGSSLFSTDSPDRDFHLGDTILITAKPLDELVQVPVDLVKIDTEGSEPFVFGGMKVLLEHSPHVKIVMEFNRPGLEASGRKPEHFLDEITRLGFKIRQLTWDGHILESSQMNLAGSISTLILSRS
jgi:FkbM family methyltransferase